MAALQPPQAGARLCCLHQTTRQSDRTPVNTPLVLTLHGQGFRGWVNDVSEDGVGLISAAALQQNDEVSVTLLLPGQSNALTLRAVVRHSCGFHHGCQFVNASTLERQQLLHFRKDAATPTRS